MERIMMSTWVGIALMAAVLVWLMGIGRRQDRRVAPEDDVETPIDRDELDAAEREIKDDPDAKAAADAVDDSDDDWGPGTGGHGPLPGIT
jgi:hypothetical protein